MNVVWSPSPNWNQRDRRYPLQGDVSHRIVGSGPSAIGLFSRAGTASSHFVIGHTQQGDPCPRCPLARGPLVIWQCVDLALMAWTNGDVNSPTWPLYQAGVNPNLTTITTEHEDMGAPGGHVVTDHIWEASRELKKLLRSGDIGAIRGAGIRVSDGAFLASALVSRMASLPVTGATYIDHHQIAGPNKPWCWRNFDLDTGFPARLPGLLTFLAAPEVDVPVILRAVRERWTSKSSTDGSAGFFTTDGPGVGTKKWFTAAETVESYAETTDGKYRALSYNNGTETLWMHRTQLTPIAGTRQPATGYGLVTPDCTVQVNDAKKATAAQNEARIGAWVATRPPILP